MAGSVLTRTQGTARINPAAAAEATADSVPASQAAIPARGARSGHAARGSHRVPAADTAVA